MMTLTPDLAAAIEACRAAIDEGHDDHLPILADALEEAGDPRAAGLRAYAGSHEAPKPQPGVGRGWEYCHEWRGSNVKFGWTREYLSVYLFNLTRQQAGYFDLRDPVAHPAGRQHARSLLYRRRSAAILALAEALTS